MAHLTRARATRGRWPALEAAAAALGRSRPPPKALALQGARLRAGRGAVPEHPHAAEREAVRRHRRRPRREPGHHRRAAQRPRVADGPLRRDPRARDGGRAAGAASTRSCNWTDPGPGGFYDDLGDPMRQPHLVRGPGLPTDPGSFRSAAVGFGYRAGWRLSWMTHAESFYEGRVEMRYDRLDPTARYRVAVVYAGDVYSFTRKLRLDADGTTEVHGWISKEGHPEARRVRHPSLGHRRWRPHTDLAARTGRRRVGTWQPDRGSVAAEGDDRLGVVAERRQRIRGLKDFRDSRTLRNPSDPAASPRQ